MTAGNTDVSEELNRANIQPGAASKPAEVLLVAVKMARILHGMLLPAKALDQGEVKANKAPSLSPCSTA